jgi:hypothetical protein
MHGYLAVKLGFCPSDRPPVLDSRSKRYFTAPPRMKIDNTELLKSLKTINNDLLRLIM